MDLQPVKQEKKCGFINAYWLEASCDAEEVKCRLDSTGLLNGSLLSAVPAGSGNMRVHRKCHWHFEYSDLELLGILLQKYLWQTKYIFMLTLCWRFLNIQAKKTTTNYSLLLISKMYYPHWLQKLKPVTHFNHIKVYIIYDFKNM